MHGETSAPQRDAWPQCVLMTTDAAGGVWDYSLQLCAGLAARGVRLTLAVMGPPPSAHQRAAAARVHGLTLVSRDFRLEWMDDPWDDVDRAGEWLLELAPVVGPDVVHLNGYAHGALPWRAPVVVVAHSCVCSWWEAVHGEPAPASWNTYRERVRAGLLKADVVVAPTNVMLAALARHYGHVHGVVIPNGRSAADFSPRDKTRLVFSAGRVWDEAKSVRLLASAAPHLPWPVYVAGDAHRPDSRDDVDKAERLPNLHLIGRLSSDEMREWLARAAIYALPAKYEPFGLAVLEAALSECALVLGDIPSLRENWDGAALFVPTDDRGALIGAIRALAADHAWRERMAAKARARAAQFGADRMTSAYLETYAALRARVSSLTEAMPCGR